MKFSIKHFFGGCRQIRRKLRIWSHLLGKSLMEGFIFCAVCSKFESSASARLVFRSLYRFQWYFTHGFDFRHSLWLPFMAAFAVLKGLSVNYLGNVLKLDQHKTTHNFEKSFTFPKCEKKFLQKDNMLQHVKNIH